MKAAWHKHLTCDEGKCFSNGFDPKDNVQIMNTVLVLIRCKDCGATQLRYNKEEKRKP